MTDWYSELNAREKAKFQEGFSAFELARAWAEPPRVPIEVEAVLAKAPFANFEIQTAIVEKTTSFDSYGTPRSHDLVVIATSGDQQLVVGIEAKVNEDFGATLKGELRRCEKRPRTNLPARTRSLSEALFGRKLAHGIAFDPQDALIRFQLLTALAGTLVEAKQRHASVALLLLHEFHTTQSALGTAARSNRRILDFVQRLGVPAASTDGLIGPFTVPGNAWIPNDVPCYLTKIRTVVSPAHG